MQETLLDHHSSISIDGRPICNLRFADDIDLAGGSNGELPRSHQQTYRQSNGIWNGSQHRTEQERHQCRCWHGRPKLEEVNSFKYLEATLCKDGTCSAEIRIRIASAMTAMARLNRIRRSIFIRFASNFKLYKPRSCHFHPLL